MVKIMDEIPKTREVMRSPQVGTWISNMEVDDDVHHQITVRDNNDSFLLKGSDKTALDKTVYYFRCESFDVDSIIRFQVAGIRAMEEGSSIAFGVTKHDPVVMKDINNLPQDASALRQKAKLSSNWLIEGNILPDVYGGQIVQLKRTENGITITTDSVKILFEIKPTLKVFPFFAFNGIVQVIKLMELQPQMLDHALVMDEE